MARRFFSRASHTADESANQLHKLCRRGAVKEVREYVEQIHNFESQLTSKTGGLTPLHEATKNGHYQVVNYLLNKAGRSSVTVVNCPSDGGYTPLHFAASKGHVETLMVLLNHGADMKAEDEYGKTPKQTAELSSKRNVVRILRSAEIVRAAESNADDLKELLRLSVDQLEPNCLDRALAAAVRNDNPNNVGRLVLKGAHIKEALEQSKHEKKLHARGLLLLIQAAFEGKTNLVKLLFNDLSPEDESCKVYQDEMLPDIVKIVTSGKVPTVAPIEIARRCGQPSVREELLLKTDVNEEEKSVHWQGLRLISLDVNWLCRVSWVQRLRLERNGFRSLPPAMGLHLTEVVKVSLDENELEEIPDCLLQLPKLEELNLAHNKLKKIPDIQQWSPVLTTLDLSYNCLQTLPLNVVAPAIQSLSIAFNKFREMPMSICSFENLRHLDLNENPDISYLPVELEKLKELVKLVPPSSYVKVPKKLSSS